MPTRQSDRDRSPLFARDRPAELRQKHLHVLPHVLLLFRAAALEQGRRVERAEDRGAHVVVELTAQLRDPGPGPEQVLGGHGPEAADYFRPDQLDRAIQVLPAVGTLVGFRLPVPGRAAPEDVADEYVFPAEPAGRDDPVEQLPGDADERLPLPVLVGPRGLADEADLRPDRADPEHRLRPGRN